MDIKKDLTNIISKHWEFKITNLVKIDQGLSTLNFKAITSDSKDIFIKVYNKKVDLNRKREVLEITEYYKKNDIPVVLPIMTVDREYWVKIQLQTIEIYPFIDGKTKDVSELSDQNLKDIAKLQATTHKIGVNYKSGSLKQKTLDYERFYTQSNELLELINSKEALKQIDTRWIELIHKKRKIVEGLNNEQPKDLGKAILCHNDIHNENILFKKDNIVTLIDFELAGHSYYHSKLLKSLDLMIFENGFSEIEYEKVGIYMNSYKEVFDIDQEALSNNLRYIYLKRVLDLWPIKEYYKGNKLMGKYIDVQHNKLDYLSKNYEKHIEQIL
jgi:Ser/Thr protein kinase RdoA (MazF antagonist)